MNFTDYYDNIIEDNTNTTNIKEDCNDGCVILIVISLLLFISCAVMFIGFIVHKLCFNNWHIYLYEKSNNLFTGKKNGYQNIDGHSIRDNNHNKHNIYKHYIDEDSTYVDYGSQNTSSEDENTNVNYTINI